MKMMRKHAPQCAGFTVVEALMVLTVVGLLGAIAYPRIDLAKYRVNTAMQTVGSTLLGAQRLAVTRQHDIVIRFDESANAILLHEDADNDGSVNGSEREVSFPLGEQIAFGRASTPAHSIGANAVNFTKTLGGLRAVVFHRNGSGSESSGFYVTTRRAVMGTGPASDTRMIEIERSTGRPSWHRYDGSAWQRGF